MCHSFSVFTILIEKFAIIYFLYLPANEAMTRPACLSFPFKVGNLSRTAVALPVIRKKQIAVEKSLSKFLCQLDSPFRISLKN